MSNVTYINDEKSMSSSNRVTIIDLVKEKLRSMKVVFFDYDDTLCIHKNFSGTGWSSGWWDAVLDDNYKYYMDTERCAPNPVLQDMCKIFKRNRTLCHILTWADCNGMQEARWRFIHQYYPDIFKKLFIMSSREGKLVFLERYAAHYGIKKEDILIIEDHPVTLEECLKAGFSAMSASEACYLVDMFKNHETMMQELNDDYDVNNKEEASN